MKHHLRSFPKAQALVFLGFFALISSAICSSAYDSRRSKQDLLKKPIKSPQSRVLRQLLRTLLTAAYLISWNQVLCADDSSQNTVIIEEEEPPEEDILWVGPGWYGGVWINNEDEYNDWHQHYYNGDYRHEDDYDHDNDDDRREDRGGDRGDGDGRR